MRPAQISWIIFYVELNTRSSTANMITFCSRTPHGARMDGRPLASSPRSSPYLDSALAALPLSSPSRRDGRSSTDIVAFQLDDDQQGYFDAAPSGSKTNDHKSGLIRPTGIPLPSPDDSRSQETTSTDKLDKEFQDGEELILAQAEMELGMGPLHPTDHQEALLGREYEDTPKATKRKRSVSKELLALPPDIADSNTVPNAVDQDNSWSYTEDVAYAASKFGGIGEYLRHKRMKLYAVPPIALSKLMLPPTQADPESCYRRISWRHAVSANIQGVGDIRMFSHKMYVPRLMLCQINGYVRPSLETLRELIMLHGGTYIPYLDRKGMMYVASAEVSNGD